MPLGGGDPCDADTCEIKWQRRQQRLQQRRRQRVTQRNIKTRLIHAGLNPTACLRERAPWHLRTPRCFMHQWRHGIGGLRERWSPWGWRVQGSRGLELNQCEFPGAYHRCYQRLGHLFDSYTSTRSKRCPSKSASSATPIGWAGIAEDVARNIDKLDEGIARVTGVASLPRQTWKMRWPLPDSRLRGTQPLAGNRGVTPGAK